MCDTSIAQYICTVGLDMTHTLASSSVLRYRCRDMQGMYQAIVISLTCATALALAAISFNLLPFIKQGEHHKWVGAVFLARDSSFFCPLHRLASARPVCDAQLSSVMWIMTHNKRLSISNCTYTPCAGASLHHPVFSTADHTHLVSGV